MWLTIFIFRHNLFLLQTTYEFSLVQLLFGFEVLLGLNFSIICKRKSITTPTPRVFLIEEEDIMIISRNNVFSRCNLKNATLK